MPGHRHARTEAERLAAAGGVRRAGADVRAHQFGRKPREEPALHGYPADRVDIVAGPEAVDIARHPGVRTPAPAGAAFYFHRWMRGPEPREQSIGPGDLCRSACRGEIAVVIPLEIADRHLAQQCIEHAEQIIADVIAAQIEDQLVTRSRALAAGLGQHPIGVSAVQIAVRVDHLGFDPQAEFHPQAADLVGERLQAIRVFDRVAGPVAQPGGIVCAALEPAIVEHEAFGPDRGGSLGQFSNAGFVVIEIASFPAVEMDQAGAHCAARPGDHGAHCRMVLRACPVAALHRHRQDRLRRGVALSRSQLHLARRKRGTRAQQPETLVVALHRDPAVTRPAELQRVDQPGVMRGSCAQHDHPGRTAMARYPAPGATLPALRRHRLTAFLQFGVVAPAP